VGYRFPQDAVVRVRFIGPSDVDSLVRYAGNPFPSRSNARVGRNPIGCRCCMLSLDLTSVNLTSFLLTQSPIQQTTIVVSAVHRLLDILGASRDPVSVSLFAVIDRGVCFRSSRGSCCCNWYAIATGVTHTITQPYSAAFKH